MSETLQNPPPAAVEPEDKQAQEPVVTADTVEDRLVEIGEWLIHGVKRADAVKSAMASYGVGRRAAQGYVHDAMNRLAREGAEEHRLFQLRVSQQQRENLAWLAMQAVDRAFNAEKFDGRGMAALINAANKALDGRDRAAAEIHKLLEEASLTRPRSGGERGAHHAERDGYDGGPERDGYDGGPERDGYDAAAQDAPAGSPESLPEVPENVARQSAMSPQADVLQAHPHSHHLENVARPGDAPGAHRAPPADQPALAASTARDDRRSGIGDPLPGRMPGNPRDPLERALAARGIVPDLPAVVVEKRKGKGGKEVAR